MTKSEIDKFTLIFRNSVFHLSRFSDRKVASFFSFLSASLIVYLRKIFFILKLSKKNDSNIKKCIKNILNTSV